MTLHLTGKAVDMKIRKSATIAARLMDNLTFRIKARLHFRPILTAIL